jgi:4-alpha-glucanotransferase
MYGRRQTAAPDVLLLVLRALGAAVERLPDAPAAVRARRQALWARGVEPVVVAWEGAAGRVKVRRPAARADTPLICRLRLESGDVQTWTAAASTLETLGSRDVEGVRYVAQALNLPRVLPLGYHRLTIFAPGLRHEATVMAAPRRAYDPPGRRWGLFCPVHALQTDRSPGSGDLTDLETLITWVGAHGGDVAGTLPLLAAFLDAPCEPSPYVPASRLFWNELYVDPARAPEFAGCPAAQALLESPDYRAERAALRAAPLVDYPRQAEAQRRVLAALADCFWAGRGPDGTAFRRFLANHPRLEEYARFRAVCAQHGGPWPDWPAAVRDGNLPEGSYDDAVRQYHVYAQWLAHQQLDALVATSAAAGVSLYLDLPLGVHAGGYDTWRERALFADGVAGGAPPDAFFNWGQNWGFPPPHPDAARAQGHAYFVASVRHLLGRARVLRVDHIIGLHRLFWIPRGCEAREGVYVRYPAEEMYAVLNLESHRHRALIVGEDLGLVPAAVRAGMQAHGISGMYVGPFEVAADPSDGLAPVPEAALAGLNTHDLPPFAAWWQGLDLADRHALGLLDGRQLNDERGERGRRKSTLVGALENAGWLDRSARAMVAALPANRQPTDWPEVACGATGAGDAETPSAATAEPARATAGAVVNPVAPPDPRPLVLRAWLAQLAASPARIVLINVEDLWLETAPQNVPGTWRERPNWRRKVRHPLATWDEQPGLRATLESVDHLRRVVTLSPREQGDRR